MLHHPELRAERLLLRDFRREVRYGLTGNNTPTRI